MKRVAAILLLLAPAGCSTSDYDRQFDRSFQQYRDAAASGIKGRAVARPAVVDGAAPADGAAPVEGVAPQDGQPAGAMPPGAAPGVVAPAAPQ